MTDQPRLIEHAFPLEQASLDSVHEKNVRHGHISTLHIWPARRPLAACRAALIATLLPDPGTPEERKKLCEKIGGRVVSKIERKRMPNGAVVERIKKETQGGILHWLGSEPTSGSKKKREAWRQRARQYEEDLEWFRQKILEAYGGRAPKVLDPFAGGGAIPLEAMRLGCEATAVDINPVAWFILKCTLEYPQKLAGHAAVSEAVEGGLVWLTSGPASVLEEPVPAGVLTEAAELQIPPAPIGAPEILPANLPDAWKDGTATALSVATALSNAKGVNLPWKTIRDVINASLQARFTELAEDSGQWPCDFPAAQSVKLKESKGGGTGPAEGADKLRIAEAQLEPVEIQDLGDAVSKLWEIKAKSNVPIVINVRIEIGDGEEVPPQEVVNEINALLSDLKEGFQAN